MNGELQGPSIEGFFLGFLKTKFLNLFLKKVNKLILRILINYCMTTFMNAPQAKTPLGVVEEGPRAKPCRSAPVVPPVIRKTGCTKDVIFENFLKNVSQFKKLS